MDDGWTDDTAQVAVELGAKALSSPYSMGNGAAIKRGARAAAVAGYHERIRESTTRLGERASTALSLRLDQASDGLPHNLIIDWRLSAPVDLFCVSRVGFPEMRPRLTWRIQHDPGSAAFPSIVPPAGAGSFE